MGVEGTKLRLHVLPSYPHDVATINGEIEAYSKSPQKILSIEIKLYEVYSHGRGDEKRIDEYLLGTWTSNESFWIDDQKPQLQLFKLSFDPVQSNMDKIASKGPLRRGLVQLAKSMKGVSSDYRLEAEAVVEGLKWKPFTKTKIQFG